MTMQQLKKDIEQVTMVQIYNEAQRDMRKEFGIFITYFLFYLPKYDKWYQNRINQIKEQMEEKDKVL
jgi:hypothetical protein